MSDSTLLILFMFCFFAAAAIMIELSRYVAYLIAYIVNKLVDYRHNKIQEQIKRDKDE